MKYNFSSKITLDQTVLDGLIANDGALVATGELKILTQIELNTELSDEKEQELVSNVNTYLSSLGHDETVLVSKE